MAITEFKGEYRWLSNFHPAEVYLDGDLYPSVENAYQAAKTTHEFRLPFQSCTAGEAKRLGRKVPMRPSWDADKVRIMRHLISQKFMPHTDLAKLLSATGDAKIIEGNTWGDTFWGICNGEGENNLGKLLMAQREYLRVSGII
jgi:ribA/ribD-fused uncharacterized protein